ncbi:MAG: hypothetical protein WC273_04430 [Dehalococcoidia bacterium]
MFSNSRLLAVAALAVAFALGAGAGPVGVAEAQQPPGPHGRPEPEMLGIHWARGGGAPSSGKPSPLLTYHNGPILPAATVSPIFWGAKFGTDFLGDKQSGLNLFYAGANGSSYMGTNTEYNGIGGYVTTTVHANAVVTDLSKGPTGAPKTSTILAEVQKLVTSGVAAAPNSDGSSYYPVYIDGSRGTAGYCAWHSWGSVAYDYGDGAGTVTVPIQFGFFFNLDGDSGCDPQSTVANQSQGLKALANVSAHELSEAVTDPRGTGWYDRSGYENSDKCAWTFGGPSIQFTNGTAWKVQGNWSNAAYTAKAGYTSGGKQVIGCIDGTNP